VGCGKRVNEKRTRSDWRVGHTEALTKTTTALGEAAAQAARSETGNGVRNMGNGYN